MSQSPSLEQILETHLQTLALTLRPSPPSATTDTWPTVSCAISTPTFRSSAGFPNCAATPTCSAGSAGSAHNNRPCATKRTSTIWSASAAYSTTSPPTATPSRRT